MLKLLLTLSLNFLLTFVDWFIRLNVLYIMENVYKIPRPKWHTASESSPLHLRKELSGIKACFCLAIMYVNARLFKKNRHKAFYHQSEQHTKQKGNDDGQQSPNQTVYSIGIQLCVLCKNCFLSYKPGSKSGRNKTNHFTALNLSKSSGALGSCISELVFAQI